MLLKTLVNRGGGVNSSGFRGMTVGNEATTGESLGVSTIRKLDEKTSFAIQSIANMKYAQMRELQRNFWIVLGCTVFSSEYRIKQLMWSEFVAPALTGVYYYGKQ